MPYVPQSTHHESKAIRRKVLTFVVSNLSAMSVFAVQSFRGEVMRLNDDVVVSLHSREGTVRPAMVPVIAASFDAISFILVQLMYLRHVQRRPYISDPPSSSNYDPLNEAELMGVRALCWGAFVFGAKEIISTRTSSTAKDMAGNALCVIVLFALFMSQRPLFYGVAKGVRELVSAVAVETWRASGTARGLNRKKSESSTLEDAEDGKTSCSEIREEDVIVKDMIQAMGDSDSPVEMLKLQKKLAMTMLHVLPARERPRWTYIIPAAGKEKGESGCFIRVVLRRIAVVLAAVLTFFGTLIALPFLMWFSATTTYMRWVLLAVLCVIMIMMEGMIWKAKLDERRICVDGTAEALAGDTTSSLTVKNDVASRRDLIELVDNPMRMGGDTKAVE